MSSKYTKTPSPSNPAKTTCITVAGVLHSIPTNWNRPLYVVKADLVRACSSSSICQQPGAKSKDGVPANISSTLSTHGKGNMCLFAIIHTEA